jgi:CrcB protein
MNWLPVIAGAMVGAPLRCLTDRAVQTRVDDHNGVFPSAPFPSRSPAASSSAS